MPPLAASPPTIRDPFDGGPFRTIWSRLRLGRDDGQRLWLHALIIVAVSWLPLAILTALEGHALAATPREAFLLDIAAHGRYLVAAPLFVVSGYLSFPELSAVVRSFVDAEIIKEPDLPRYQALVNSTRRLLTSGWTAVALIILAYASTLLLSSALYPTDISTWVAPSVNGQSHRSLAGWWRALVSQPIFQTLLGVWLWRILLWARFLWCVVRMDLRLVASHPDRLGGLRFVMIPLRGYTVLAFAIGAITASSVGESMVFDGRQAADFKYLIGAQVLFVIVLFAGPLMALSWRLLDLKIKGTLHYGSLASELGRQFESRWITSKKRIEAEALAATDFSATTDLYSVAANVRNINVFVVDLPFVIAIAIATLLPYVPVILATMPFDEIVRLAMKTVL